MARFRVLQVLTLFPFAYALSVPFPYHFYQAIFTGNQPADLPHPDPTHSFWTHSPGANPLAGEGSAGELTDEADVCIIGSGITGVSAAYHLANSIQHGTFPVAQATNQVLRAVILEARDFCGRNGGNLTPYEFSRFRKQEALFGREAALRLYALEHYSASEMARIARTAGWADAVDLVEGGHMDILFTEEVLQEAKADFDAAVAAGKTLNVTWLDRDEMNSTYGTHNLGARSPGYNVWPLKFVTQLFKQARKVTPALDLRLHTRTPVTRVSPLATASLRRWELTTPRGAVQCSYVLHATNGYASHLLPHMAGSGPTGIIPVRGQVMAMRANATLDALSKISWADSVGYWFPRPVADAEAHPLVILGGARESAGPPFEMGVTDDSVVNATVGGVLRALLPTLFPGLYAPGREPEAEWTGIMGYTALGIPFVGPVLDTEGEYSDAYKGQFIAAGYHGHGMPRTFACAEVVVQMIAADLSNREWVAPAWFPRPFLTSVRDKLE
ncbi:FAD dependent oxidoreductase-domain-containing protein [Mycena metata]|uniref:FAD dependent oxidoreductase-domain-containing protein n=1 Tax=Mycena metata TaxID=1033252 RepID=A0AAD7H9D5_9AGAR|nr:FAD dependent oxidoreductase-domain-containing protein [Mycena metata]